MKLPATIRTLGTSLALLACASLAFAGAGVSLDDRAHEPAAAAHATPPVTTLPAAAFEDAPGLTHGSAHGAPALRLDAASGAPRAPQVPASDHRADKREHGRPVPSTALHVHRPATQRSKGSLRNSPATPGMGLLLRMGTGAGRELSLFLDDVPSALSSMRSGRAPPRAAAYPTQARDPIASAAASAPRFATPQAVPPGVAPPPPTAFALQPADHPRECPCARAAPPTARGTEASPSFTPERSTCSRAERLKGASA
jgi:hypothetical protein